jgi:hypothetical protein
MSFERILNRAQEMFKIYEENKQPMYNEQKIRWLMSKINKPLLAATIEAGVRNGSQQHCNSGKHTQRIQIETKH